MILTEIMQRSITRKDLQGYAIWHNNLNKENKRILGDRIVKKRKRKDKRREENPFIREKKRKTSDTDSERKDDGKDKEQEEADTEELRIPKKSGGAIARELAELIELEEIDLTNQI